jgi:hydroxyacylglutathione hydrolase
MPSLNQSHTSKAFNYQYDNLSLTSIVSGEFRQNSYLIKFESENELFLLDPGFDQDFIQKQIENTNKTPTAIILTHAHFDHIESAKYFSTLYNIDIYFHKNDKKLIRKADLYSFTFANRKVEKPIDNLVPFDEVEKFYYKNYFTTLFTPGHTQGSCSYIIGNQVIITGDTLLNEKAGFSGFPEGNQEDLKKSLIAIMNCDNGLMIFPGHGKPWTLKEAKLWWEKCLKNNKIEELNVFKK